MPRHRTSDQVGYDHDIDTLTTRILALERALKALDPKKPTTVTSGPTYTVGTTTDGGGGGGNLTLSVTNATGTYSTTLRLNKTGVVLNDSTYNYGVGAYSSTFAPTDTLRFATSNSIELRENTTTDGILEFSFVNVWYQEWPQYTTNKTLVADEWAQFDTTSGALYATAPSTGFSGGGRKFKASVFQGDNPVYILENPSFNAAFQFINAEPRYRRLLWPGEAVEYNALFSAPLSVNFKAWVCASFLPGQNRTVTSSTNITAKAGGTYLMDATAGNRVVTLDLAQLSAGAFGEITVIKTDATANTVTIASQAGFTGIGSGTSGSVTPTATTTNNSRELTAVSSFTGLFVGQAITGTNIPAGTTIIQLDPANSKVMLSALCTGNGSGITVTCNYTEAIEGLAGADVLANKGESITLRPSVVVAGSNKWSIIARVV